MTNHGYGLNAQSKVVLHLFASLFIIPFLYWLDVYLSDSVYAYHLTGAKLHDCVLLTSLTTLLLLLAASFFLFRNSIALVKNDPIFERKRKLFYAIISTTFIAWVAIFVKTPHVSTIISLIETAE